MKRSSNSDPAVSGPIQNIYLADWMDVYSGGVPIAGSPSGSFLGAQTALLNSKHYEVSVTSIADGFVHAAGNTFLGLAVDCYWFDESVTESNVSWAAAGHAGYYKVLGPNRSTITGDPNSGDGTDGTGTWGMRRDTVHLDLDGTGQIARLDFAVVVHDSDMIGEVWMTDFELRAVA